MGRLVDFSATVRPSAMYKACLKHQGDVSEGDRSKVIATRVIAGRKVTFYTSGEHIVDCDNVTAEEMFDSEVLRFAHASLICGQPVGSKELCYVDASQDPCEVWIYGRKLAQFINESAHAIRSGSVATECVIDGDPTHDIRTNINGRNERPSRGSVGGIHFP